MLSRCVDAVIPLRRRRRILRPTSSHLPTNYRFTLSAGIRYCSIQRKPYTEYQSRSDLFISILIFKMKAGFLAIAAALATGVVAKGHAARRHAHEAFHLEKKEYAPEPTCGCTTIYTTITGSPTRMFGYCLEPIQSLTED